jgi:predicted esterase
LAILAAAAFAASPASGGDGDARKPPAPAPKADDSAKEGDDAKDDIPTLDLKAGGDEHKRYLVHGPRKDVKQPKGGWKLLYVLPGGDGGENFKGFVKNIRRQALSDDYVAVQLVSVKWRDDQTIVWPTKTVPAKDAKFTTEEFFAAVHAEVKGKWKPDPKYVFALGWSSGGPPVYTLALQEKAVVTGAYVAMSVFKPDELPKLAAAKGRPFFIDHSPDDTTCPFRMAEAARDALKKAGADVEFVTYEGGHGWKGAIWDRLKQGIAHLEKVAGE